MIDRSSRLDSNSGIQLMRMYSKHSAPGSGLLEIIRNIGVICSLHIQAFFETTSKDNNKLSFPDVCAERWKWFWKLWNIITWQTCLGTFYFANSFNRPCDKRTHKKKIVEEIFKKFLDKRQSTADFRSAGEAVLFRKRNNRFFDMRVEYILEYSGIYIFIPEEGQSNEPLMALA